MFKCKMNSGGLTNPTRKLHCRLQSKHKHSPAPPMPGRLAPWKTWKTWGVPKPRLRV